MEKALSPTEFRAVWAAKPVLRAVYGDYYRRMGEELAAGRPVVEIGAGSGNLKEAMPAIMSSDIVHAPWLDLVMDAQTLPFADASVANLVGVDILHHVEYPRRFLAEAERVLKPGGRVVLVEPGITPLSHVVYKLGHPEPVDMKVDPLADGRPDHAKHPMASNQATPTLLAGRYRGRLEQAFPGLRVARHDFLSLAAYPLSGGFRPWSLMPAGLVDPVLRLEGRLEPAVGHLMGFRLLLVIERRL